jgi:hypothetical protein
VSTRRPVVAGGQTYLVVDDLTITYQALVVGQAVDELTGRPPIGPVRVRTTLRLAGSADPLDDGRLLPVAGDGGSFALAGVAAEAFPSLASTGYQVDLAVTADGYLTSADVVDVPAGTTQFPRPPRRVELRRPAVRLAGRVMKRTGTPSKPVAATVQVTAPAGLVGLGRPLAFTHRAVTPTTPAAPVLPVNLQPVGADLDLLEDAAAGATRLRLGARTGLGTAGTVVQLGTGSEAEYAVADALEPPAGPGRPGPVRLRAPLRRRHRLGTPVRRATVTPLGAGTTLARDAFPEDEVAFLQNTAVFTAPATVQVGTGAQAEYLLLVPARSTATAGHYRLGPVGRATTLTVSATGPDPDNPAIPLSGTAQHVVDYGRPDGRLDLRI